LHRHKARETALALPFFLPDDFAYTARDSNHQTEKWIRGEDLHSRGTERREEARADEDENSGRPFLRNETVVGEESKNGRDGRGRRTKKKFKEDFTGVPVL
jgi:hypothetical protein